MHAEVLDCCGVEISTRNLKHHKFIDCFKSIKVIKEKTADGQVIKKEKFFKKITTDGREIKKEIALVTICPQCNHYILRYLWYIDKNTRFYDYDDTKILRGDKADEVFSRYVIDFVMYPLPSPYKNTPAIKHAKKIPWIYGKCLNGNTQVPRYYNESENAGLKIYTPIKITPL